ncbi:uncharacterized protein LOC133524177 [Cydia pomonella]|uniref:uncharacterized protein LOC133524177 n=1 Tax=Cydia pomonella TaxID=82600 RepID=UPI002ADDB497|nr:uncharacterized protein LOC133524177 [Cydia pomonella]
MAMVRGALILVLMAVILMVAITSVQLQSFEDAETRRFKQIADMLSISDRHGSDSFNDFNDRSSLAEADDVQALPRRRRSVPMRVWLCAWNCHAGDFGINDA